MKRGSWAIGLLVSLLLAGVLAWRLWPHNTSSRDAGVVAARQPVDEEPRNRNPGYVGPQVCGECHARRLAEVRSTTHFVACRPLSASAPHPGFSTQPSSFTALGENLRFEMRQSDRQFLETAFQRQPAGERRATAAVAYVYGTGVADEVYHAWDGDSLWEMPVSWIGPLRQWGLTPVFRASARPDFMRETTTRCIECHTTWIEHIPGTPNRYRKDDAIIGVTCEKCHGPGQEHVAYHREHRDAKEAVAIVNPHGLERERRIEVCTQCHSNVNKPRTAAFTYRPGAKLEDYFRTALTPNQEDDHVANQVKYLRLSKCFQQSADMTCTTCHDPHRPPKEKLADAPTPSCAKCHSPEACHARESLPAAVRNDCVGCHMPPRVWMNVNFLLEQDLYVPVVRRYEHRIAVHPEASNTVLFGWFRKQSDEASKQSALRLQKDIVEHWLQVARDRQKAYRFRGAIGAVREALRVDDSPSLRTRLNELIAIESQLDRAMAAAVPLVGSQRYAEAVPLFEQILKIKPDLATAHGKLGTALASMGQLDAARPHLAEVAHSDPDSQYGEVMLGWLAYNAGNAEEALRHLHQADAIEPYTAKIHHFIGLAEAKLDRWPEALASYRFALTIDPNYVDALVSISEALVHEGQPSEALSPIRRAARLTGEESPSILLELAKVSQTLGHWPEAESALVQALDQAKRKRSPLENEARQRLASLRAEHLAQQR